MYTYTHMPHAVSRRVTFCYAVFTVCRASVKIIGPGGKTIRQIIEDFELDGLDVEDDGRVMISSYNSTRAARCGATRRTTRRVIIVVL